MTDDRFLTRAEVEQRFSIARSTIYRLMRSGAFPEPIRIGPRAVRWRASDLDDMARQQALRPGRGRTRGGVTWTKSTPATSWRAGYSMRSPTPNSWRAALTSAPCSRMARALPDCRRPERAPRWSASSPPASAWWPSTWTRTACRRTPRQRWGAGGKVSSRPSGNRSQRARRHRAAGICSTAPRTARSVTGSGCTATCAAHAATSSRGTLTPCYTRLAPRHGYRSRLGGAPDPRHVQGRRQAHRAGRGQGGEPRANATKCSTGRPSHGAASAIREGKEFDPSEYHAAGIASGLETDEVERTIQSARDGAQSAEAENAKNPTGTAPGTRNRYGNRFPYRFHPVPDPDAGTGSETRIYVRPNELEGAGEYPDVVLPGLAWKGMLSMLVADAKRARRRSLRRRSRACCKGRRSCSNAARRAAWPWLKRWRCRSTGHGCNATAARMTLTLT